MIEDLKDLKALLKLCRSNGVTKITLPSVAFELGDLPVKHPEQSIEDEETDQNPDLFAPLSPQEIVQYASGDEN